MLCSTNMPFTQCQKGELGSNSNLIDKTKTCNRYVNMVNIANRCDFQSMFTIPSTNYEYLRRKNGFLRSEIFSSNISIGFHHDSVWKAEADWEAELDLKRPQNFLFLWCHDWSVRLREKIFANIWKYLNIFDAMTGQWTDKIGLSK